MNKSLRGCYALLTMGWLLTGCVTSRYLPPDGQLMGTVAAPAELAGFEYTYVPTERKQITGVPISGHGKAIEAAATAEIGGWFEAAGDDVSVTFETTKVKNHMSVPALLGYIFTLTLIPASDTTDNTSTLKIMSGDDVLFENTEQFRMRSKFGLYFPTPLLFGPMGTGPMRQMTSDQLQRHKMALGMSIAQSKGEYEKAVAAGTVAAYRAFLEANPDSFFRMETLRRLSEKAPTRNALAFHRDNVAIDPAYITFLPDEYDVWFVGPPDMHVYEVLQMSRREKDSLVAARIRAAKQPYKVFSDDEIALLKEGGMPVDLIAAMIDATAMATPAPTVQTGTAASVTPMAIAPAAAAPVAGAGDVPAAQNTVGDVAAQCAKRYAAMKACDQIPSFGANVCRSQVKKKYSHLVCSVIQ